MLVLLKNHINLLKTLCLCFCFLNLIACKKKLDADTNKELAIESFLPLSGKDSTTVTVYGNSFSPTASYNVIIMGAYNVVPESASANQLTFKVPAGIPLGSYNISVKVNGKTVTSAQKFEVTQTSGQGGNFVSTDVIPVNESIVSKCFTGMGKGGVHPRLFFSSADIARIKSLVLTDQAAKGSYDDIINRANAVLSAPVLDYGLDAAGLRIENIHTFSNEQLPYLVLAYQFTKDSRYALRCWQQLDRMCSFPDWGANRHFLDAGIAVKAAAMAYDGLFDYLSADQRTRLANAMRSFVLQPGKTQIETGTGPFKWYLTDDNWNGICHGGMLTAALALYETDPIFMSKVIALCANGMEKYINSLEPDGASEEGMSYWSYGLSNTFLAFESMKRCLSTTYGLAEKPGFTKTGWFPYNMSGPVGTATIGDDYIYSGKNNKFLSYFWFSNYFNNSNLAKTHYDNCLSRNSATAVKFNGWTDLLYYNPQLVGQGSSTAIGLNNYIKGIEYMYVLENYNDNAMYIGMHGGDNAASHGHLDAGSFYVQGQGETFALGNLGAENPYPADYFTVTSPSYSSSPTNAATSRGRFYYYRVRAEGKNCLVFNPDARPDQNPAGKATVAAQGADGAGGYYILNLQSCYDRDVSAYKRGIKLNRSSGVVTVQDEFTPSKSSLVYWLMQSPATDGLQISTDGKTATIIKNGKTLYAVIKSPANAVFDKVDRSDTQINYLPETAPAFASIMSGKNTPNKYYGKLQIKLANVAAGSPVTIRVDFQRAAGTTAPVLTGLNNWTTGN